MCFFTSPSPESGGRLHGGKEVIKAVGRWNLQKLFFYSLCSDLGLLSQENHHSLAQKIQHLDLHATGKRCRVHNGPLSPNTAEAEALSDH